MLFSYDDDDDAMIRYQNNMINSDNYGVKVRHHRVGYGSEMGNVLERFDRFFYLFLKTDNNEVVLLFNIHRTTLLT